MLRSSFEHDRRFKDECDVTSFERHFYANKVNLTEDRKFSGDDNNTVITNNYDQCLKLVYCRNFDCDTGSQYLKNEWLISPTLNYLQLFLDRRILKDTSQFNVYRAFAIFVSLKVWDVKLPPC